MIRPLLGAALSRPGAERQGGAQGPAAGRELRRRRPHQAAGGGGGGRGRRQRHPSAAASRSRGRGSRSCRPTSWAATTSSRRRGRPASSAWSSPRPTTPSASIRASAKIGTDVTVRPDSRYGVSKAFGEALGALYADKHGMVVTCLRIGNVGPRPLDVRRLSIWISPRGHRAADPHRPGASRHPLRDPLRRVGQRSVVVGQFARAASSAIGRPARPRTTAPMPRPSKQGSGLIRSAISSRAVAFCAAEFTNDVKRAGP